MTWLPEYVLRLNLRLSGRRRNQSLGNRGKKLWRNMMNLMNRSVLFLKLPCLIFLLLEHFLSAFFLTGVFISISPLLDSDTRLYNSTHQKLLCSSLFLRLHVTILWVQGISNKAIYHWSLIGSMLILIIQSAITG